MISEEKHMINVVISDNDETNRIVQLATGGTSGSPIQNRVFKPEKNITAFELAQIISIILGGHTQHSVTEEDFYSLGDATRHFSK